MGRLITFILTLLTMHFAAFAQQPLPFPTDNLQLWLRADSVELTDGKVSRWYDLSPNQYEIVQTNATARPAVAENALNGQPALTFNGTSTFLTGGDILDLGMDSWTWFVVGRYNNGSLTGDNAPVFLGKYDRYTDWGRQPIWKVGKDLRLLFLPGNANPVDVLSNITSDSFTIRAYEIADRATKANSLYNNNNVTGSNVYAKEYGDISNNIPFKIGHFIITNSAPDGNFLDGQIAEIIAFNTVDSSLRNQVYSYLLNKYSAQVSLGLDIYVPYGYADTAITTAYKPDFVKYQWSTGETDSVIHVNKTGKYWVTVTNAFGYTSSDTINVYYPEPVQLTDTTICAGDVLAWDAALNGPYSYLWNDGSTEKSLAITAAGEYWLTITDTAGYTWKSDTITVSIDDYPLTTSFIAGNVHIIDTALCSGNALGLAVNDDVTTVYQWNSNDATMARIRISESGDYTLISTNNRGCQATNTAHVNIKGAAPIIDYSINNLCYGDQTEFVGNATSEQGIASYLWIVDGTDSLPTKDFQYGFATAGAHSVKLEVASNNTCLNDSIISVDVKDIPVPDFSFMPVCAGLPMDFIADNRVPNDCSVAQYEWSVNGTAIGTDENLNYTFGSDADVPLTYTLTLDNGCMGAKTIDVPVKAEYATPRRMSCVYPVNGQFVAADTIDFLWNTDADILYYELITSADASFATADTIRCTGNSYSVAAEQFGDTTYWKVRAYNHCMRAGESSPYMFRKTVFKFSTDSALQLWLRADSVELTDGKVSRWYDLSSNQYEIVQTNEAARPAVTENALNGQPALTFNGTSTFLTGGDILDLGMDSWTWFVVGRYNNGSLTGDNAPVFLGKYDRYTDWGRQPIWKVGKDLRLLFLPGNANPVDVLSNITSDSFTIRAYEIADRATKANSLYNNNNVTGSNVYAKEYGDISNNIPFKIGHFIITNSAPDGNFLDGQIAEIIAFNTVDSSLRNQVYSYLLNKYSAQVSLGLDIYVPYGYADTAITTAYKPDFVKYQWSTGETDSVIHVNKTGKYWVTVTNAFGYTSSDTINVYYPEPVQLTDTTICAGDVLAWDAALNGPYSYLWSDGSTDSSLDISTAGEYWVTITDTLGFKWYSDTITVAVDSFPVTARLEGDQINSCIGNNIYLQNGYDEAVGYLWSDGSTADHLAVTESGQYWVKVTDRLGCKAADTANISVLGIAPTPDFTHTALCATRAIEFSNLSHSNDDSQITAYLWQFGDGGVSVEQSATHSYALSGTYSMQLTVSSSNGCSNILKKTLVVDSLPAAAFAPAQACSFNDVQFTDLSTTPVSYLTEWQWTMNDSVFAERNPHTTFRTAGDIPVQLVVSTAHGCTDTLRSSIIILQGPDVDFGYSATCLKTPVYFSNRTTSAFNLAASYQWLIDDEEKSTMRSPNFVFTDTGTYKISLTVKQLANGCVATRSRYINILPPPDVRISAGTVCQNQPSAITATNIEPGNIVCQWVWIIDKTTGAEGQTTTVNFETEGRHSISVTATDTAGCTDKGDTTIVVRPIPTALFTALPDRGPVPFETELLNNSTNADSYEWLMSDGTTSQAEELSHTFAESGSHTIALVAKNQYGCIDTLRRIVTAIVPNTDLVLIDAESDLSDGYISISALVANNSPYDLANTVINWNDNLGHNVREVIADTIKSGKIYHYTFTAKIGADTPNRLKYICVNVEPDVNDDNTPDNNQFCITMNPDEFSIEPAKPNPADNLMKISYIIPEEGNVKIELYNQTGLFVGTLFNGTAAAGYNELRLDASLLKSGMYHYRITYGGRSRVGVVMVMH